MDVRLIQVPYHAGDERLGSSEGAARLLEAGAGQLFRERGLAVASAKVDRGAPFRDTATSAAAVNKRLAALVAAAVEAGHLPIALTGSCNSALGMLAGFEHARCGAVWLDAHADFNTPESSESGFLPGMSTAIVTGHCYRSYYATIGDARPLPEEAIAMFGVRDLSPPAERERLERSAIRVVGWRDGRPERDVGAALDELAARVGEVYLHIDLDAFAPEVAPGIADAPVPGGLSLADAEQIVRATGERFSIRAAALATYTPALDRDDRTLKVALRLLELLADYAGEGERRLRSPREA
jgi:arginase